MTPNNQNDPPPVSGVFKHQPPSPAMAGAVVLAREDPPFVPGRYMQSDLAAFLRRLRAKPRPRPHRFASSRNPRSREATQGAYLSARDFRREDAIRRQARQL